MTTALKNLEIMELSLVDEPANPDASITIFKSKDGESGDKPKGDKPKGEGPETDEDEDKAKDDPKETEEYKALVAVSEGQASEILRLTKALDEAGFDVEAETIEKRKPVEYITVEGEEINKALVPAVILKQLESQAAEIAEQTITKRISELMPNTADTNARVLLKSLDGITGEEEKAEFISFIEAMDKLFSDATVEIGKSRTEEVSVESEIETMVEAYKAKHGGTDISAYAAIAATQEGATLISKSYSSKK